MPAASLRMTPASFMVATYGLIVAGKGDGVLVGKNRQIGRNRAIFLSKLKEKLACPTDTVPLTSPFIFVDHLLRNFHFRGTEFIV